MHFITGEVYHIYNRGNNKQPIFFNDRNYIQFLKTVRNNWKPYCEILCWCLMPNHFHFMIQTTDSSCVPINAYGGKSMQMLAKKIGWSLSTYAQYINRQNNTSGSLFQQKTKAKCIAEYSSSRNNNKSSASYLQDCMHYIHQNPWKAGLVNKMEDWSYSSFQDYAGLRQGTLCNMELMFQLSDYNKESFYQDSCGVIEESRFEGWDRYA